VGDKNNFRESVYAERYSVTSNGHETRQARRGSALYLRPEGILGRRRRRSDKALLERLLLRIIRLL
jgi:hypothetical protein